MGAMELEENTVQIRDDFDPDKILESGQCFRPRKQAEAGIGLFPGDSCFTSDHCAAEPTRCGVSRAHGKPSGTVTSTLAAAMPPCAESWTAGTTSAACHGIRPGHPVLRQDEWEMLVSFIISQRKSIPAIRRAVELLSERFGERLGSDSEGRCMRSRRQKRSAVPGSRRCRSAVLATAPATCCMRRSRRQRAHWT